MAGFGYGLGAGLLSGLTENIRQGDKDRLTEALLMGDIMGLQGELGDASAGAIPTGLEPRSGLTGTLSALGLRRGGGNIEQLIMQRQQLARKAADLQKKTQHYKTILDSIRKGELDFGPEEEAALVAQAPREFQFLLPSAIRKIKQEKQARAKFQGLLTGGVTSRIGSTGAQEEGEEATDIITNRPASRAELTGAAAGIPGLQDDALRAALAQPKDDPTSLIQPGPGTPASIVNRRTGAVNPLPRTERPSPSADPVMNEYRRLRNDLMRNRLTGVETPAQRQQSLQRLINLALTLKKNADPGSPEEAQYDGDLRRYLSELNRLQAGRKAAPTPTPGAKPGGGGGLPPGWKFAD